MAGTCTFHSLIRAALPENIDDLNVRPKFGFRQWYDMTHPWHLSTFAWVTSFELHTPGLGQNILDRLGVNPLKFLFEHILRGNTNVFHLEAAAFGPNALAIDLGELLRRAVKYLVEGVMVALAAYTIPKRSLNLDEVLLIALTAAATFSILDTYVPSMAVSARSGAGFGIGANLVGFPRL